MSVLWVRETTERGGSSSGADGTLRRTFRVRVSSRLDNPATIQASGMIPGYLENYPGLLAFTCRDIDINQEHGWAVWKVACTYSNKPHTERERERQEQPNPLDRRAKIRWTAVQYQEPCIKDVDGEALMTAAGEPYDPPVEVNRSRWIATVQKHLVQVPADFLDWPDAVNSTAFTLDGVQVLARKARIAQADMTEVLEENGQAYRTLTLQIEFHKHGWEARPLHQGFKVKANGSLGASIFKATDDKGNEVTSPVLLAEDGTLLADPSPANAVFQEYTVYAEMDFNDLPLT